MTGSGYVVREARPADAGAMAEVYNQAVLGTTATFDTIAQAVEERAAWLAGHGERHPVVVAEHEGRVVAWASLSEWNHRPAYARTVELSTYVDDTHHGRGLGRLLGHEMLERARSLGHHAVIAQISAENSASLALSGRLGFEEVGRLREVGNKFGRWLDVVLLEKVLDGDGDRRDPL